MESEALKPCVYCGDIHSGERRCELADRHHSSDLAEALEDLLFAAENESGNESLGESIRRARAALSAHAGGETVPADVAELVMAARVVAFDSQCPKAIKRLDRASEAFADRVEWEGP